MKPYHTAVRLLCASFLVAGCGATPIVMKNPKTDQVIVCDGGARAREWPTGQMTADACAEQLRSGGWVRVDGKRM